MKQQLHFITLGVKDFTAMRQWYMEKFEWAPMVDQGDIVFFNANGVVVGLYPLKELAKEVGAEGTPFTDGLKPFTLSVNYSFEREVDKAFADLKKKGVTIVREPEKVFWGGYRGYIADPEGNHWELAYNPFLVMDDRGRVARHS